MAQKSATGVSLIKAVGIRNPFINNFTPSFFIHPMKRVASISSSAMPTTARSHVDCRSNTEP
jgi:hypothetical protein